ncbi:MAG: transcriptional repressor LexA [Alphaproteobacteria bacterium]|nr:transcriptional repressor LexA [Alphaproteobacteria bacterium]
MLTKKQRDLLVFIHDRMSHGDIAPSFEEMKDALDLKSKSGIHRLITGLVERGYLLRLPNRARALEVVKLPEGVEKKSPEASPQSLKSKINDLVGEITQLPLLGKIAAGTPIEAIQHEGETFEVPASLLGSGEHYALRVEGDSMINAGIHDDDVVIIRRTPQAPDGRIVVALVDGQEVTLKRLYRREGKIILEPENDAYKPRVLTPDRVQIQGELSSLIRTYH